MIYDAVDCFSGAGGWAEGLASLGLATVGIELDPDAAATHAKAGHATVRADVSVYPPERFAGRVAGVIASPPCQAFSQAGKREGWRDAAPLVRHARACAAGWHTPEVGGWQHPSSPLVLEPLRWVAAIEPEWVALEQVPAVLPMWEATAYTLRAWGYSAWAGVLSAEQYGVPQTRSRAVLVARRSGVALPPEPTHQRYEFGVPARAGDADLFGGGFAPWISMAEALGWDGSFEVGFPRRDDRGDSEDGYRERDWRGGDEPSFALTEKARSWTVSTGANSMKHSRVGSKAGDGGVVPFERSVEAPAPVVDAKAGSAWRIHPEGGRDGWEYERPATTLMGDARVFPPGGHRANDGRDNDAMVGRSEDARRLEPEEALVLQSFPADYPVVGTKTSKHRQIGNAVPPLLARAIVRAVID